MYIYMCVRVRVETFPPCFFQGGSVKLKILSDSSHHQVSSGTKAIPDASAEQVAFKTSQKILPVPDNIMSQHI